MKFLLDQDIYLATAQFLTSFNHDIVLAAEIGLSRSDDNMLLEWAKKEGRILVTRDRDFGELVFLRREKVGVIYLRISYSSLAQGHKELERILTLYNEAELLNAFIVVQAGRHRFRKLSTS
jgi:predicted nuclease of predicted toxin-antitoxin system